MTDSVSASTETLSDEDLLQPPDASQGSKIHDFPTKPPTTHNTDLDSEETVTEDDAEAWESGSDLDALNSWNPSQRLTARQLARQQRLLQGINQTQWNDLNLPKELDLGTKGKQMGVVSEEQHLKRMKAAELRRIQSQKARRATLEITKARIRAATSNKFRDMVSTAPPEAPNRRVRSSSSTTVSPGFVRTKKRKDRSEVVLPLNSPPPKYMEPKMTIGYPPRRIKIDIDISEMPDGATLELGLPIQLAATPDDLTATNNGFLLGRAPLQAAPPDLHLKTIPEGRVTSIRFDRRTMTVLVLA